MTVTVSLELPFVIALPDWNTDPENAPARMVFDVHLVHLSCFMAEEWGREMGFNLPFALSEPGWEPNYISAHISTCVGLKFTFPSPFYMHCPKFFFTLHNKFHAWVYFVFLFVIIFTSMNLRSCIKACNVGTPTAIQWPACLFFSKKIVPKQ